MVTLNTMYPAAVNSKATVTMGEINASTTTVTVLDASVLPAAPNLLVLGTDQTAETVLLKSKSGNTLTIQRGVQGSAKTWPAGTQIARNFTAKDLDDIQENIKKLFDNLSAADLLWENTNSIIYGLEAKSVSVPGVTDYDFIMVVFVAEFYDGGYKSTGLLPVTGVGMRFVLDDVWLEGGGVIQARNAYIESADSIYFMAGKQCTMGSTTVANVDTACTPRMIYGIKL